MTTTETYNAVTADSAYRVKSFSCEAVRVLVLELEPDLGLNVKGINIIHV